jgi:hypothetical protein
VILEKITLLLYILQIKDKSITFHVNRLKRVYGEFKTVESRTSARNDEPRHYEVRSSPGDEEKDMCLLGQSVRSDDLEENENRDTEEEII